MDTESNSVADKKIPQVTDLGTMFDQDVAKVFIFDERSNAIIGSDHQPWYILVAGPTHAKTIEARNISIRQTLKDRRKAESLKNPDKISDLEIETVAENQSKPLELRTLGWGPIALNGKEFSFTPENVKALYRTSQVIRLQVERFINGEAAFLQR